MSRYQRQAGELGPGGQDRLGSARVLVAGAGGLGATLLPALVGAGIGEIRLFDPDRVEEGNLHRQTLFRTGDIGLFKAPAAAGRLKDLNPDCRLIPEARALDPALSRGLLPEVDLVIDAADRFAVSYGLSDLCLAAGKPLVSASVLGRQGYVGGFCGGAPSLRAVFPDLPPVARSCAEGGVLGPAVATLGGLMAQMALSILAGLRPSPLGQVLVLDLASWRLSGFRFDGAPEPPCLPPVLALSEVTARDTLIDLRRPEEAPLLPGALRRLEGRARGRVVFACTTGLRAWRAARALAAEGHDDVAVVAP